MEREQPTPGQIQPDAQQASYLAPMDRDQRHGPAAGREGNTRDVAIARQMPDTAGYQARRRPDTISIERRPPEASQLSFLAPEDVELLTMMRHFMAEASRLYETRATSRTAEPTIIRSPADIFELLRLEMGELEQEQLRTVNVDVRHQVLSTNLLYQGTASGTLVRVAEVFRPAVVENASGLIVVHNHPSGDPTPSSSDISLTRRLRDAGKILDIEVLDHLIVARDDFTSLRERGLGFES